MIVISCIYHDQLDIRWQAVGHTQTKTQRITCDILMLSKGEIDGPLVELLLSLLLELLLLVVLVLVLLLLLLLLLALLVVFDASPVVVFGHEPQVLDSDSPSVQFVPLTTVRVRVAVPLHDKEQALQLLQGE